MITKTDAGIHIDKLIGSWSTDRSQEDLFPHAPSIADINQQRVGERFLLTSLGALLTVEPDGFSLYAMMRDLGTGWVLVRFFKDVGPEDRVVLAPYCVKIQKTVPKFVGFGKLYARGPLWVAMLEKAYAAAHYKGSYEASLRGGKPREPSCT